MLVGISDVREESLEHLKGALIELSSEAPSALMVPPGVAHGFYIPEPTLYVYGMTHPWDPVNDEFGCRWDDEALAIPWPAECTAPDLSPRDDAAGSLSALLATLRVGGQWAW
jgi:dTDP-4-dehydrorhamnose 3,5-epimerase